MAFASHWDFVQQRPDKAEIVRVYAGGQASGERWVKPRFIGGQAPRKEIDDRVLRQAGYAVNQAKQVVPVEWIALFHANKQRFQFLPLFGISTTDGAM